MGVSGAGKSSVANAVAQRLDMSWVDADALHPPANIAKMSAGIPLDDTDRMPWLDAVGAVMRGAGSSGVVIACSALRRIYRDRIRGHAPSAVFVHLDAEESLLRGRLRTREGHFMPSSLLESQLATLERLHIDEVGFAVNVDADLEDIVDSVQTGLERNDG